MLHGRQRRALVEAGRVNHTEIVRSSSSWFSSVVKGLGCPLYLLLSRTAAARARNNLVYNGSHAIE